MVKLKRAYDPASRGDGFRVLVERLWPRGVRKNDLVLDSWEKVVAPSHELRKWFAHDPERWTEFQQRYRRELKVGPAPERLRELAQRAADGIVTLVFSSHDTEHNNAVVLKKELERMAQRIVARTERDLAPSLMDTPSEATMPRGVAMEKRQRRKFTAEFKAKAVQLIQSSNKTVAEVARDLDLTPSSLGAWLKQAEIDAGRSVGALTTERDELSQLRKENRILKEEREILKKAAAFFAKEKA